MTSESETLALAKQLINIRSITPEDNGCQTVLADHLNAMGFKVEHLPSNGVKNIWARHGDSDPLFIFSGHTDVVPPGPESRWTTPPFNASTRDGYLYGRGAADMKGALAAMMIGCQQFIKQNPNHPGSIGFMITSDEEGSADDGTVKIVDYLQQHHIVPKWCIIGEASSNQQLGDVIKVGRRGSLHGELRVFGKQGHIAYPQLADNPIHRSFKALDALTQTQWDQGNEHFTPTSLQIYNINADTGASNIIPGSLTARFNFRFSPTTSSETLQQHVHDVFDKHELHYKINWNLSSQPFLSPRGELIKACKHTIKELCNITPEANTAGGTSDGRFISKTGCEIVELGAVSQCIHQVNEHIKLDDLEKLTDLYFGILKKLLT